MNNSKEDLDDPPTVLELHAARRPTSLEVFTSAEQRMAVLTARVMEERHARKKGQPTNVQQQPGPLSLRTLRVTRRSATQKNPERNYSAARSSLEATKHADEACDSLNTNLFSGQKTANLDDHELSRLSNLQQDLSQELVVSDDSSTRSRPPSRLLDAFEFRINKAALPVGVSLPPTIINNPIQDQLSVAQQYPQLNINSSVAASAASASLSLNASTANLLPSVGTPHLNGLAVNPTSRAQQARRRAVKVTTDILKAMPALRALPFRANRGLTQSSANRNGLNRGKLIATVGSLAQQQCTRCQLGQGPFDACYVVKSINGTVCKCANCTYLARNCSLT